MIDKEKEIVQALRCCAEGECKDCAMHEDKQRCQENLLDKAAEAIERLTAENAALREKVPLTEDAMINLAAQALGVEPSRLRELAEADKDGRVVVLPCKVGDVMYKLFREYTECTSYQVRKDNYCCEGCMVPCDSREVTVIRAIQPNSLPEVVRYIEDIGKTVFFSREEAEKALRGMEGKKDG